MICQCAFQMSYSRRKLLKPADFVICDFLASEHVFAQEVHVKVSFNAIFNAIKQLILLELIAFSYFYCVNFVKLSG